MDVSPAGSIAGNAKKPLRLKFQNSVTANEFFVMSVTYGGGSTINYFVGIQNNGNC